MSVYLRYWKIHVLSPISHVEKSDYRVLAGSRQRQRRSAFNDRMYRTVLIKSDIIISIISHHKHRRPSGDDIWCTFKCRSATLQLISERESAESLNRESEVDSLRIFDETQNTDNNTKSDKNRQRIVKGPARLRFLLCSNAFFYAIVRFSQVPIAIIN